MKNQIASYKKVQAHYTSPVAQVAILLERAARHMLDAHEAILSKNYEQRFVSCDKTIKILSGLALAFKEDAEEGNTDLKTLLTTMDFFYRNTLMKMNQMSFENNASVCMEIVNSLKEMAQTWQKAAMELKTQNAPTESQ